MKKNPKPIQADEAHIVNEHLIFWQVYDPSVKCELSCVATKSSHGWVLIDPILLTPQVWEESFGEAKPLGICLTNSNHARAALHYQKQWSIPIAASTLTSQDIEIPIDIGLEDGAEQWGLQVRLIPGATPGETAYLSREGALFLGDSLINLESHGLALLPDKYCWNAGENVKSLKKCLDTDFSLVTFAHGNPLRHRAKERLTALLSEI